MTLNICIPRKESEKGGERGRVVFISLTLQSRILLQF